MFLLVYPRIANHFAVPENGTNPNPTNISTWKRTDQSWIIASNLMEKVWLFPYPVHNLHTSVQWEQIELTSYQYSLFPKLSRTYHNCDIMVVFLLMRNVHNTYPGMFWKIYYYGFQFFRFMCSITSYVVCSFQPQNNYANALTCKLCTCVLYTVNTHSVLLSNGTKMPMELEEGFVCLACS